MNVTEQYARNFAKAVHGQDSLDCLSDNDRRQISRIFDHFYPEYHDQVVEYPLWITKWKNQTPRDKRRAKEAIAKGKWPMFLFSHARIEKYLDLLEQLQNDSVSPS
jgi:hypothetical protein